MNNISINYALCKNVNQNIIDRITSLLKSEKYKVSINIYDFSLEKKAKEYVSGNQASVIEQDYEEYKDYQSIIVKNFTRYADASLVVILHENVFIHDLDSIDLTVINDNPLHGFIYTDYNMNGVRCFVKSHGPTFKMGMPLVFWSKDKIIQYLSDDENPLGVIYHSSIGIHIPKDICTVYPYENEK